MLLELENVDMDMLEQSSKAWGERYKAEHKFSSENKAKKNRKAIKIKWLIPVAALMSILCITVVVSYGSGIDVWNITKEAYCNLTEKIEYLINGSSVTSTSDYRKYQSLNDLIEHENISGILLPISMPEEYEVNNISYDDLDKIKRINMDVFLYDKKISSIFIKTSYNANFSEISMT